MEATGLTWIKPHLRLETEVISDSAPFIKPLFGEEQPVGFGFLLIHSKQKPPPQTNKKDSGLVTMHMHIYSAINSQHYLTTAVNIIS